MAPSRQPPPISSKIPPIFHTHSPIDSPLNPQLQMIDDSSSASSKRSWQIPLLRLECRDICDEGSAAFFAAVNAEKLLNEAVVGVLECLYTYKTQITTVRSVTLILRSMNGVAYTTGSDLDSDHKEIHFSTDYIKGVHDRSSGELDTSEILGVIRHEMVHCFQFNARGTANGGLIEGIADWVRLQAGFSPPHWKKGEGNKWDDGYQNTAYFLQYLEDTYGKGTVPRINEWMRDRVYTDKLWVDLFGAGPVKLWEEYQQSLEDEKEGKKTVVPRSGFVTKVVPKTSTTSLRSFVDTSTNKPNKLETPTPTNAPASESPEEIFKNAINNFLQTTTLLNLDKPLSEIRIIARDRLSRLEYSRPERDFGSFYQQFERLLKIVDPDMPDSDKIHLLGTSVTESRHGAIYDKFLQDPSITYDELVQRLLSLD